MRNIKVTEIKARKICDCGRPNFRDSTEFHKPMYRIFEVSIPENQFGEIKIIRCEYCLMKLIGEIVTAMGDFCEVKK